MAASALAVGGLVLVGRGARTIVLFFAVLATAGLGQVEGAALAAF